MIENFRDCQFIASPGTAIPTTASLQADKTPDKAELRIFRDAEGTRSGGLFIAGNPHPIYLEKAPMVADISVLANGKVVLLIHSFDLPNQNRTVFDDPPAKMQVDLILEKTYFSLTCAQLHRNGENASKPNSVGQQDQSSDCRSGHSVSNYPIKANFPFAPVCGDANFGATQRADQTQPFLYKFEIGVDTANYGAQGSLDLWYTPKLYSDDPTPGRTYAKEPDNADPFFGTIRWNLRTADDDYNVSVDSYSVEFIKIPKAKGDPLEVQFSLSAKGTETGKHYELQGTLSDIMRNDPGELGPGKQ